MGMGRKGGGASICPGLLGGGVLSEFGGRDFLKNRSPNQGRPQQQPPSWLPPHSSGWICFCKARTRSFGARAAPSLIYLCCTAPLSFSIDGWKQRARFCRGTHPASSHFSPLLSTCLWEWLWKYPRNSGLMMKRAVLLLRVN